MFSEVKNVVFTTCTFEKFGPGGFGTFLYSVAPTLALTMDQSIVRCYTAAPVYANF